MKIRKSTTADIPVMQHIFAEAKAKMRASGNMLQWTDGYPSDDVLKADIQRGFSYVVTEADGKVIATFVLAICDDPTYKIIYDGEWLDDQQPYGTIHRIASREGVHGVMAEVLRWSFGQIANIRVDTHRDNLPMQHLLLKHGFTYCGIIYLLNGDERLAYQKITTQMTKTQEMTPSATNATQHDEQVRRHTQITQLALAMIDYDNGDPKRIQHTTKVHAYAALIGLQEGLDDETLFVLESAALVHDIGIRASENKYGHQNGKLQEQEGPAVARQLLNRLGGYTEAETERICWLVGHHHTYYASDAIDYQILIEADFLVNLYEDHEDSCCRGSLTGQIENTIRSVRKRFFKTTAGTMMLDEMFLKNE